ncbi:RNase P and RNase MRP subunit [Fusarium falciforme]|uniref:RNase P and RNase MRP subunit n=1 Tax=Fusarium falciforme TaxID=195108 RepID=A0A9W8RB76_9HYPO|nr:Hypothetical protein NCS54_01045000 [Fusarium falciforme]KAJ4162525.1 RNase P and RNase MRP subunit [Fusarium falciforme]KAJ4192238.1 RNase P and RNase MRP subunit [Fusarium falciforme]KAJ4254737.1 RNase P and RNase MRP subunit [Fusarium falciforme]WAO92922.1 Hypothetical protein NCS54_01045000 [Fusarium falciforme]
MTTPTSQPARKRVVHQLDTPFSTVSWPAVSPEDQDTILELLCDLLSPLGQYRQTHVKRSKGKRTARKEKDDKKAGGTTEELPVPPIPEIDASIDVGLNSITRNLQALSQSDAEAAQDKPERQYLMIFVARGNQASTFNCHFPQMVAAASKSLPSTDKIRLVGFSNPCSERLSACLGVPRVSSIAIAKNAPGAGALQEFVLKSVPPAEAAWLDASRDAQHLTTKINAIETTVGPKRPRMNETTS